MAAILTGVTDRFSQNKKLDQFEQISVERSLLYGILAICAYGDKNGDNGANGAKDPIVIVIIGDRHWHWPLVTNGAI